ncbi:MAG: nucleotidyltransferase domain-containing protein [Gemmatimonadaceae bacterium]
MATALFSSTNVDLDYLLSQVAEALQLSPTQFGLMEQHYRSVAEFLAHPTSPLARFRPRIYPQGSAALETTVRPLLREEYDLDFVCEMLPSGKTALGVYEDVYSRLKEHALYGRMVEKKNRCVRINYEHNFHLDIIPAEPDPTRGGTAVWVPDRALRDWTPSNPRGYVAWFTDRAQLGLSEARKAEALPGQTPVRRKSALSIAVQLMKRRRDVMFSNADVAPRSILLTTLAGEYYRGSESVGTTLLDIATGIAQRIRVAAPGRIVVCNPANPDEEFCESLAGGGRYEAFTWYARQLEEQARAILTTEGIPELRRLLAELFGEEPVIKAVRAYGELQKAGRDAKTLKFTGMGVGALGIVPGSSGANRSIPSNRYFGGKS